MKIGRSARIFVAGLLSACTAAPIEPQQPGPGAAAAAVLDEPLVSRCERRDEAALGRCEAFWAALHAGEVRELPLAQRCRLASTLALAAVDTIDRARTGWLHIDGGAAAIVVLVGPEPSTRWALIAHDESCPQVHVPRAASISDGSATIAVDILGRVARPTAPALALHLAANSGMDCPCVSSFTWRLGDHVGVMLPFDRLPDGTTRVPTAPIVRTGLLQPRIALDVAPDGTDGFVVTRRAIEVE